jgi:hypothetical protein
MGWFDSNNASLLNGMAALAPEAGKGYEGVAKLFQGMEGANQAIYARNDMLKREGVDKEINSLLSDPNASADPSLTARKILGLAPKATKEMQSQTSAIAQLLGQDIAQNNWLKEFNLKEDNQKFTQQNALDLLGIEKDKQEYLRKDGDRTFYETKRINNATIYDKLKMTKDDVVAKAAQGVYVDGVKNGTPNSDIYYTLTGLPTTEKTSGSTKNLLGEDFGVVGTNKNTPYEHEGAIKKGIDELNGIKGRIAAVAGVKDVNALTFGDTWDSGNKKNKKQNFLWGGAKGSYMGDVMGNGYSEVSAQAQSDAVFNYIDKLKSMQGYQVAAILPLLQEAGRMVEFGNWKELDRYSTTKNDRTGWWDRTNNPTAGLDKKISEALSEANENHKMLQYNLAEKQNIYRNVYATGGSKIELAQALADVQRAQLLYNNFLTGEDAAFAKNH